MTINDIRTYQYEDNLTVNDILICALGYESRSYYLLEKNIKTRNVANTLIIKFNDFKSDKLPEYLLYKIEAQSIQTEICSYAQNEKFHNDVIAFLGKTRVGETKRNIYIDYSSMPRSWYCSLPSKIEEIMPHEYFELIFLYVAGIYPEKYESYPTAGIDYLKLFSGGALPKIDSQRTHLIALSYDTRRTQGLLNMLEPEFLVVCYAYDTSEKKSEIESVNKDIIRRASASIALPIDDFSYIVQKINEIIVEQTRDGQIIVIPDGPKPLIFAMSLSSVICDLNDGITCLHITRNDNLANNKIDVLAREGEIFGVKIFINNTRN